jgi:hypothetical protein
MTIRPFIQSVISCYRTVIPAQGFFLKFDMSKEFGTGWYCNVRTDVILCDYYKLWCYLFIVRKLEINWFVLRNERFYLTAVLLQVRNLKRELQFLFCCRPEAVCQQKQNQIPSLSAVHIYIKYRVSREECARLRENVPQVKIHRCNQKHLYSKLNGYGDNGERSLKVWHLLHTYWLPNALVSGFHRALW